MDYCLYNAIKTPDGTVLWCQSGHDYQSHTDKITGEFYMNDGVGYSIRRSVNKKPYKDLSVWASDPFEKVRTCKFWASYGKDGKSPKKMLSLSEMEDDHIYAILTTQTHIKNTTLEKLFLQEQNYRTSLFKDKLNESMESKEVNRNKPKI